MGIFVISKRADGNFKFTFGTRKTKIIFTSINCRRKEDCEHIITGMKENIASFAYTKNRRISGKCFFRISTGGLVLATSRNFNTDLTMSKAISEIMTNVPHAEVLDFSMNEPVFADDENTDETE